MPKETFYKKLVKQFESAMNKYPAVNSELDFSKVEKIILNKRKDNRYDSGIKQFLVYLREYEDKNQRFFISNELKGKYQCSLEKLETLLVKQSEEKARWPAEAIQVKKTNFTSFVMQPFLTMLFLQLFTQQIITARPLQSSRYTRQANYCENPNSDHCNENLAMSIYQNDLQKSNGFSEIINLQQSIEFKFNDTQFILTRNCLSRQDLAKNPQSLCRSDYEWFLVSMATHLIRNKVRADAQEHKLRLDETEVAQITQAISLIDLIQENNRQLLGIYSKGAIFKKISESELEKFIFNAQYTLDRFQSIAPERNYDNLVSRVNYAVNSEIDKHKKLEPEESTVFTSVSREYYSRPETQSAISRALLTDINTPSSISNPLAEGSNWVIIGSAAVGGIGIIALVVAFIICYSKKNRSANSRIGTEHIPLLNSIIDSLHVRVIAGRLSKRLEFLKKLDRYNEEIGVHFSSFCSEENKEEAIKNLITIKNALTKFIKFEKDKSKNKDKIILFKLKSALLIVDSLMQRYHLLSLPETKMNKNDYIAEYLKGTLRVLINLMLINIEQVRDSVEKQKNYKLLDALLNLEKAVYDTMLLAHAEGYFEKYTEEEIKLCLDPQRETKAEDNQACEFKNLQSDVLSTLKFTIDATKKLNENLLLSQKIDAYNVANSIMTGLDSTKSQLANYFTDRNVRWELKQTQSSNVSGNSTLFTQPPPSRPTIPIHPRRYTMSK